MTSSSVPGGTMADMSTGGNDGRLRARATVNLAGLGAGQEALVDPNNPYIAGLLAAEFLVPVDGPAETEAPTSAAE